MFYRLMTEDKNRKWLIKLIGRFFDGFTIIRTLGYWQGIPEKSLIIEIDANGQGGYPDLRIENIVDEIKSHNKQEAVLVYRMDLCGEVL